MSKNIKGICALTLEECELRESHIYPKFVYHYLKQKGGNRFRGIKNPTKVLQDGIKRLNKIGNLLMRMKRDGAIKIDEKRMWHSV